MDLSEKQQYELLAAISARSEIPVKFAYLGNRAKKWDEIYHQWEEKDLVTEEEMGLLLFHIDGILNVFSNPGGINLIDLGCGNGMPAIYLLKELAERNINATYLAVDISPAMIELALNNVKNSLPGVKTESLLIDFEKESLADHLLAVKQRSMLPNLLINLGNTLGNYINASRTLTNFLEAMTLEDYLLIGNGLSNDLNTQKIIDTYNVPIIIDLVTGLTHTHFLPNK